MTDLDDEALVEQAIEGDTQAFERLVEKHYRRVYASAYRYCGIREDAEEIAHEALIKAARAIQGFRREAEFSTWLCRITFNTAKDFFRRRGNRRDHGVLFDMAACGQSNPGNPEDQVLAAELYRAIAKLPEKQKDAVLLVCAEGLTHAEAAAALEVAETTVSWRVFRARQTLQKALER
jgi:RNA polymerase sigma-70 factor (ECF subfamily)